MHENDRIENSLEDEALRLSKLIGISFDVANAFVMAEDDYFDIVGVNVHEGEEIVGKEEIVVDV